VPEYAVAGIWTGRAHGASVLYVEDGAVTRIGPAAPDLEPAAVTVMPGIVDRHVHLGLTDHGALAGGPVVEAHDLGWAPDETAVLRDQPPAGVTVRVAGPFHTAPGGYPSGGSWAPAAAVRAVASVAAARSAVADAVAAGYDILKVALHSEMPLLDDETLRRLVSAAHDAGLPVAIHAEGAGQAARAIDAGADLLAHAPWTERVPDDVLARGIHMTWCSTLGIHAAAARATAIDNIRRFRALGGRVVYGTDMGNGPTPAGVNAVEIRALGAAGLEGDELLAALAGPPGGHLPAGRLLVSPHPLPASARDAVAWFADCRRFTAADCKESHVA
jgi:imidazolonepropionase-like amidohydrolase